MGLKDEINVKEWVNDYSDYLYRYALPRVGDQEIARELI